MSHNFPYSKSVCEPGTSTPGDSLAHFRAAFVPSPKYTQPCATQPQVFDHSHYKPRDASPVPCPTWTPRKQHPREVQPGSSFGTHGGGGGETQAGTRM